jgi:hypothetical protein
MLNQGFGIIDDVVSPIECDRMIRRLSDRPAGRAGARHLTTHPAVVELATKGKLLRIARDWVGPGAVPYRCTLFEKSGERNWLVVWHQDTTLPLAGRFESGEWGP